MDFAPSTTYHKTRSVYFLPLVRESKEWMAWVAMQKNEGWSPLDLLHLLFWLSNPFELLKFVWVQKVLQNNSNWCREMMMMMMIHHNHIGDRWEGYVNATTVLWSFGVILYVLMVGYLLFNNPITWPYIRRYIENQDCSIHYSWSRFCFGGCLWRCTFIDIYCRLVGPNFSM